MALYTGKGDKGTTTTFGCNQRISKSSAISEALGALDEVNSFLGLVKVKVDERQHLIDGVAVKDIVHAVQESLFIIQAEVAGSKMTIDESKVRVVEKIINDIEKELPPITTFFISGGTEIASLFDIARTFTRRAERRVVAVHEEKMVVLGEWSLTFLNRLSSLLYAFARYTNYLGGVKEKAPEYR